MLPHLSLSRNDEIHCSAYLIRCQCIYDDFYKIYDNISFCAANRLIYHYTMPRADPRTVSATGTIVVIYNGNTILDMNRIVLASLLTAFTCYARLETHIHGSPAYIAVPAQHIDAVGFACKLNNTSRTARNACTTSCAKL